MELFDSGSAFHLYGFVLIFIPIGTCFKVGRCPGRLSSDWFVENYPRGVEEVWFHSFFLLSRLILFENRRFRFEVKGTRVLLELKGTLPHIQEPLLRLFQVRLLLLRFHFSLFILPH